MELSRNKTIDETMKMVELVAKQYSLSTGFMLKDVTGVIGEYKVSKLLDLILATYNQKGFDAYDNNGNKYEIKTCTVSLKNKGTNAMGYFSRINIKADWDFLVCAILTRSYKVIEIYVVTKSQLRSIRRKQYLDKHKSITRSMLLSMGNPSIVNKPLQTIYYPSMINTPVTNQKFIT